MLCSKCGSEVLEGNKFCTKCGTKVDIINENQPTQQSVDKAPEMPILSDIVSEENVEKFVEFDTKTKKANKKKFIFLILGLILIILLVFGGLWLVNVIKPSRTEVLTHIERDTRVSFKLSDEIYYIGDRINKIRVDGYDYDSNFGQDIVYSDSISTRSFYDENGKAMFLGALYCPTKDDCKHSETVLVKANFYEDSDVIVNGKIKFGMDYEEVVEKYGKEDGRFYQDQELYVWTFDDENEVGSPYMVLRFDEGGWFSWGGINEIRLGVFWYDGEAEHIIVPVESEEEK